jgi:hypothetical protein
MGLDIRLPIGLMFTLIGFILLIYGALGDHTIYAKSLGVDVNLVWGIVLLVFAQIMIVLGRRAQAREAKNKK